VTEAVFYFFAAVAVLSAAMCILQRSPVGALIWLVQVMLALGAIFILLQAQFIGIIQILVYAGAIMVLFLFILMLLNVGRVRVTDIRGPAGLAAAVVVAGLIVAELSGLWTYTTARLEHEVRTSAGALQAAYAFAGGQAAQQEAQTRGVVGGIAAPLFQLYLVPFEITSVLLLAAIVGAVVLAKRRA
jgi:NADH-quinone oxidoreductase subunit J